MCFGAESRPPIKPMAGAAVPGVRSTLVSADGTPFSVFGAAAPRPTGAAILILPDVRGLHSFYEELALRFAEAGVDAVAIDYFARTAGSERRPADFEFMPHAQQTRYPNLMADVATAAAALRQRHDVRSLFTIGFCFGGRLAFLTGTRPELGLAGVIGFYGVVKGPGRADMPAPLDLADDIRVPVLGLFGGEDPGIPVESVEEYGSALTGAGVENELVVYPGAPHSFFDRKAQQFAEQSADAWQRVLDFIRTRAGSAAQSHPRTASPS